MLTFCFEILYNKGKRGAMVKENVTIVEVGSSKLKAVVAQMGVNGIFNIKARATIEYAGFFEGEFVEKALLENVVKSLFAKLTSIYKQPIKKIFVGVPAEFSQVKVTTEQTIFKRKRPASERDLEELENLASQKIDVDDMEILSINPISFTLDDTRKTNRPFGIHADKMSVELSIVLAQEEFIQTFNKIWSSLGIEQVEYLSEPLCEAMVVLEKEERERTCIVIDVGARSTSVSFVKGDGISSLTSFSIGGSHITKDLSDAFELQYDDARNLKKQIVLSLVGDNKDFYELPVIGGRVAKIPLNGANEVVGYRIGTIAQTVNECIRLFASEYVPYYPIYLCGAGVSKIKGGKDYFSKCLGRNIAYGVPPIPAYDKPEFASTLGLVKVALGDV